MKLLLIMTIFVYGWAMVTINCPKNCICDKALNLKRIKCSHQNLMNIGDDLPVSVEILDISYNQISNLVENEFKNIGLESIKLLNISHNKIGHMHLTTFKNLDQVRTIDLSFNIIEYILQEWFYGLPKLKELYLSNNNFFKLNSNGPLLESATLEILDISYCKIKDLKADAFTKLSNLNTLKLNGNFLIELTPSTIKGLKNLKRLTVSENPFKCGKTMNDLKIYVNKNVDKNYIDPCTKQKTQNLEKSQKIIASEETIQQNNLWIYEDDGTTADDTMSYNCTQVNKDEQGIMLQIIEMSPIISVLIVFVTGFSLGLIIACNLQIKPSKSNLGRQPKRRYSIIRNTYIENNDPLVLNCENVYESTPIPQRRIEMYALR